jgi:tRNA threonylcarbamoyladenosine biosynthesis protein TsaE
MGAGKTTFTKALCDCLGVCDTVNSPTFAIVNEYADTAGDVVAYHFDFYRLKSVAEAIDMGAEDYFYSGAYCFLEWPELVEDLRPGDTLHVSLTEQADGTRLIEF